jgi:hypothetical protein
MKEKYINREPTYLSPKKKKKHRKVERNLPGLGKEFGRRKSSRYPFGEVFRMPILCFVWKV